MFDCAQKKEEKMRFGQIKTFKILVSLLGATVLFLAGCVNSTDLPDHRVELRETLQTLAAESDNPLMQLHFNSIIKVIDAGDDGQLEETRNINAIWSAFADTANSNGVRKRESYLNRSTPLIIAWVSPTDGQVSFTWLTLPAQWDPAKEYPLYVSLHGLWEVAASRLSYLSYPFQNQANSYAFEDGYNIAPWGRGNLWYRGISETDIHECIKTIKNLVHIDESRQYLSGHSMGGYGAWHIALGSPDTWAALGIQAGALFYDNNSELNAAAAKTLRNLPTYFVVGTADDLYGVDKTAYQLLVDANNPHLSFVSFSGGHDYRQEDVEKMYLWMKEFDRD
jgi:hypothetical protein